MLNILLLCSMLYLNGWSQEWQPTSGPFGGRVTNFTGNSEYIFLSEGLGIYASGIYRSADNGLSWEKVNNGLGSGQGNYTVSSLSVADNYVIAATGAGVYRSGDNGNNWVQCNYPSGNFVPNVIVFDGNTLYGGGVSGLFASDDHGLNWSARGTFPGFTYPEVPEIQSMAVTSGYVYVGTAYAGVYRSSDGGYTWEALNDGIGEPWMIEYLTFSTMVASGNDVLTGTPELGIFRLTNNGSVWVDENSGFPAGNTGTVRLMVNGQYAYIGTNIGLFKSSLSGSLNWEVANGNISVNSIRCLYGSGDVIFAGVYNDGVYRSIDESTTWQLSNEGMEGIIVRRVVKTGNNQLTATSYFGCPLFTRNNSGNSWAQGNHSVEVGPVLHNGYLFITYNMELLRSADNGSTWEVMSNAWNALPAYTLFTKGDTLFSGGGIASGIAYSTDDGASFQSVSGINNPNGGWPTVYCIENVGPNMFAGTLYGLFRSVDNGVNWNSCYPAMDHIRITDLEVKGDTVFAGTLSGVYMSTDFGLTWTTGGLSSESINTLKYHDGVLFAGTVSGGIYFTTDAGMNWTSYNQGLPTGSLNIGTIEIFNDTLYAGVFENFGLPVYARQFENSAPSQPSPIIGAQAPCIGSTQTYFVENVPGVTYNWQVPSGWTIISGSGTNQIFVLVGSTPGIVLVTPVNAFGNGSSQYLIVSPTSSAPLQPGSITGPVSPEIDTEVAIV
ncbi:Sortilin, neurotensin receptor 3 [anaerobic digester metagenome]